MTGGGWRQSWLGARRARWRMGLGVALALLVGIGAVAIRSGGEVDAGDTVATRAAVGLPKAAALPTEPDSADDRAVVPVLATAADDAEATADPVREAGRVDTIPGPVAAPVEWVSPRTPSPVEPVEADRRVPKPEAVRGIYVGSWPVGSAKRFGQLLDLADRTEVNAFVIDVKDATGEVSYASEVPLARQVGATERIRIADVRDRLDRLREHGIYPIARIVVFKDPLLADARPDWAIQREDGSVWEDQKGVRWVDAYNRDVWDYNIELAREALALGFSEIQWDYVRFPDAPSAYMREAVYPARADRSRAQGIREFMMHGNERLAEFDAPLTADVFGITTSAFNDVGIGQLWEEMSDVIDVLLPMVYPSHYPRGSWSYPNPNAAPYQIVKKAMDHGVSRSRDIENAAAIRPWLQAFSLGEPDYGPRHVRAQIDAVYDAGLTEWILWNPGVRYDPESLVTASGEEPWFAGRGAELYQPPEPDPEPAGREAGADPAADGVGATPLGAPVSGR